ncbi:MAG: carboxypeptidase regulatory-like domain-containing protein, partial [Rhodothermales bacterium]
MGCCLLGLCVVAGDAGAQSLSGRVLDGETRTTLPGATVLLTQNGVRISGQITDGSGAFEFARLSAGRYEIESSFVGYDVRRDTIDVPLKRPLELILTP